MSWNNHNYILKYDNYVYLLVITCFLFNELVFVILDLSGKI